MKGLILNRKISLEVVSAQELNRVSICAWRERLFQEEKMESPFEREAIQDMLSVLVSNLPALDRLVMELAYGFNGKTAVEDVSAICEDQDLTPEEFVVIVERSLAAIGERLLVLTKWNGREMERLKLIISTVHTE